MSTFHFIIDNSIGKSRQRNMREVNFVSKRYSYLRTYESVNNVCFEPYVKLVSCFVLQHVLVLNIMQYKFNAVILGSCYYTYCYKCDLQRDIVGECIKIFQNR